MNLGERARVDGHLLVFFIQALESLTGPRFEFRLSDNDSQIIL